MQIFRYKVNSVIYNAYDVSLTYSLVNDINPVIYRNKLSGSITFDSDLYDYILTQDLVYYPFSVEQLKLSDSTWNEVWSGFFDIRTSEIRKSQKKIIINTFKTTSDIYDEIQKSFDVTYPWEQMISSVKAIYGAPETSRIFYSIPNIAGAGLTATAYKAAYDVDGYPLQNATPDPRWAYYIYVGLDPNNVPYFHTMAFKRRPLAYDYVQYDLLTSQLYKLSWWIKLPPSINATESYQTIITERAESIITIIDNLLDDAGLSFDVNDFDYGSLSAFEWEKVFLCVARNIGFNYIENLQISMKKILDFMEKRYNLFWDIDISTNHFKLRHPASFSNTGSVDLTSETSKNARVTPIYQEVPDIERWKSIDSSGGSWPIVNFGLGEIEYQVQSFGEPVVFEYETDFYVNVSALLSGEITAEDKNFGLLFVTDETATPLQVEYDSFEDRYNGSMDIPFAFLMWWRYWDDSRPTNGSKVGYTTYNRPIWRYIDIPYQQDNDELITDIDKEALYTTSFGDGRLNEFKCNLRTNTKTLTIDLYDLI